MVKRFLIGCIVASAMFGVSRCRAQGYIDTQSKSYAMRNDGQDAANDIPEEFHGMLRVTHPKADSLRKEIAKLHKRIDEMSKQLKVLGNQDLSDDIPQLLDSANQLLQSPELQKLKEMQIPEAFGFSGKLKNLPDFEYHGKTPFPSVPQTRPRRATPNPNFPGWKIQLLGGDDSTKI